MHSVGYLLDKKLIVFDKALSIAEKTDLQTVRLKKKVFLVYNVKVNYLQAQKQI